MWRITGVWWNKSDSGGGSQNRILLVSEFYIHFDRGEINFEMKFQSTKSLEWLLRTDYFPFDISRLIKLLKSKVKGKVKPTISSKCKPVSISRDFSLTFQFYSFGFLFRVTVCRLLFQKIWQTLSSTRVGHISWCVARSKPWVFVLCLLELRRGGQPAYVTCWHSACSLHTEEKFAHHKGTWGADFLFSGCEEPPVAPTHFLPPPGTWTKSYKKGKTARC